MGHLSTFFKIFIIHKPSLGPLEFPHKILGPIGSAVLMLIGYKQTNAHPPIQTDKKSIYIDAKLQYIGIIKFKY